MHVRINGHLPGSRLSMVVNREPCCRPAWVWIPAVWLPGRAGWPSEGTSLSLCCGMGLRYFLLPGGSGGIKVHGPVLTLGSPLWTLAFVTDTIAPCSLEQKREGPEPRVAFQQRGGGGLHDLCLEGHQTQFCRVLSRPEMTHENCLLWL